MVSFYTLIMPCKNEFDIIVLIIYNVKNAKAITDGYNLFVLGE